jgi:hypothetical protein
MEGVKKTKQKPRGVAALGAGPGRPKGVPNKITTEFRETVNALLRENSGNVSLWLSDVARDDPSKALDLLCKLAEYATPKLARTELAGDKDAPLVISWQSDQS